MLKLIASFMACLAASALIMSGISAHASTTRKPAQANAPSPTAVPSANNSGAGLPRCIFEQTALDQIVAQERSTPKTPQKYDAYRALLEGVGDDELLARLAYSETLAANCSEHNAEALPLVLESIMTRVKLRKGNVTSVVFQRDQYSSSLNIYLESRYKDFLCPRDAALWQQASPLARVWLSAQPPAPRLPSDAAHYYLYLHSARLTVPEWATEHGEWPIVDLGPSDGLKSCIRFFRDSKWR